MDGEIRQQAARLLLQALDDPDDDFKATVLRDLELVGNQGDEAAARVAKLYRSSSPRVRSAAVSALGSIGPNSRIAAAILAQAANAPQASIRRDAVGAL